MKKSRLREENQLPKISEIQREIKIPLTPKLVVFILIYRQGEVDGSGTGMERSRVTLTVRACFARINLWTVNSL